MEWASAHGFLFAALGGAISRIAPPSLSTSRESDTSRLAIGCESGREGHSTGRTGDFPTAPSILQAATRVTTLPERGHAGPGSGRLRPLPDRRAYNSKRGKTPATDMASVTGQETVCGGEGGWRWRGGYKKGCSASRS
jgi:hypothetical protein